MSNVINKVLKTIYHNIPIEVLQVVFQDNPFGQTSLDESIIEKVIVDRVLDDCNIGCGKKTKIILKPNYLRQYNTEITNPLYDTTYTDVGVYAIPPEARENRNITSAIKLEWTGHTISPLAYGGGKTAHSLGTDALYTMTGRDMEYLPRPILLDNNVIKLDPPQLIYSNVTLVCFLEYDKYFTNLNSTAVRPLCNLVLCATKSFIYNELYIKMNRTQIVGGHEIGAFREIVENYSGEWERYDELLKKFRGGSTMDAENIMDIIKLALP